MRYCHGISYLKKLSGWLRNQNNIVYTKLVIIHFNWKNWKHFLMFMQSGPGLQDCDNHVSSWHFWNNYCRGTLVHCSNTIFEEKMVKLSLFYFNHLFTSFLDLRCDVYQVIVNCSLTFMNIGNIFELSIWACVAIPEGTESA